MCGFLGWIRTRPDPWSETERALQQRVLGRLRHRGPDDEGEAVAGGLWMGFRRLSIIDLTEAGRQPMVFGGGRYTLTFNGEIYNYRALRKELAGPSPGARGDTAVLGQLLAEMPVERVLEKVRGMFAFAWWDAETRELLLVRDHFGIKPLYHEVPGAGGEFRYGSELRSVHALMGGASAISRRAVVQYARWGAAQTPETALEDIRCLQPGHLLRWKAGKVAITRYFQPRWPPPSEGLLEPAAQIAAVREGLLDSVRAHLVSDVPVGVFLSGGLDSTLIAACMRHLGQERIQAFSIGYDSQSGVPDESSVAERTARHLGLDYHCERLDANRLEARLDSYFAHLDRPTSDALNIFLVSELAAREVKVTLSGLGADEWFGGYNHYRLALVARQMPALLSRLTGPALRLASRVLPVAVTGKPAWKLAFHAGGGAGSTVEDWHTSARAMFEVGEIAALVSAEVSEVEALLGAGDRVTPADVGGDALNQLMLMDTAGYLTNTLLRDNDCVSMAHSLELRVPFVDQEMFRLAGRLPPGAKIRLRSGKWVLREAFRDLLPEWIYHDRAKNTFTLPMMKWMRSPRLQTRIRDVLGSRACRERGWTNPKVVDEVCRQYFADAVDTKAAIRLSLKVWILFVLESWALANLDRP